MMQPKITKRGDRYLVRYDEYVTIDVGDGTTRHERKERTKSFPTEREARARATAISGAHARGEAFVEAQHRPVARLRDVSADYARAAANPQTRKYRMSMMNKLLDHLGEEALVTDLSGDGLRAYARAIEAEGLKRVDRFVGEVERMWAWAEDRELAGVPKARRIVGTDVITPPPVFAIDSPTWEDCDAMIAQLGGWHRRVAVVLRYTGVRASQALTLDRSDLDLERSILRLRANARGSKGAVRHRAVPLHPALVAELRGWGLPERGPVFVSNDVRRTKGPGLWREDALGGPFTRAWKLAGVPEAKWGAPEDDAGGSVHARPAHSFRGAFKVGLLSQGVSDVIVNLLVGHANNSTHAACVPEGAPSTSPYWAQMVAAIGKVPVIQVGPHLIAPED